MKTPSLLCSLVALCMTTLTPPLPAAETSSDILGRGLLEEEANQNLEAAIQAYEAVVEAYNTQRQHAATAVFRIGECYRKQGKTREAMDQYRLVLSQFADQPTLVQLSRQNLEALGTDATSIPTLDDGRRRQIELLNEEMALLQEEEKQAEMRFRNGVASRADLVKVKREVIALQRQIVALETPTDMLLLDSPITETEDTAPPGPAISEDEAKELQRVRELVKHSPDLITAAQSNGDTPLIQAAGKGYLELCRFLVEHGAEVNRSGREFRQALHNAAEYGHLAIVSFLLDNGAEIDHPDSRGNTPLHLAANRGRKSVAERLLADGANVSAATDHQMTPLHYAAREGFTTLARLLLNHEADVNGACVHYRNSVRPRPPGHPESSRTGGTQRISGYTPLQLAAEGGFTSTVQLLLDHGATIDTADELGETALLKAVAQRREPVVKVLLDRGANPNLVPANGESALFDAVNLESESLLQLLLEKGANPNATNTSGVTPLYAAVQYCQTRIAEILLDNGANPNVQTSSGSSALHEAVIESEQAKVRLLLDHQANPNLADYQGRTPLLWAAMKSERDLVQDLLQAEADPNLADKSGYTPLHVAGYSQENGALRTPDDEIFSLLLANGADPNRKDNRGQTPLHRTVQVVGYRDNLAAIQLLLDHNADPNVADEEGNTPMHIAARTRYPELIELLLTHGADPNRLNQSGETTLDVRSKQSADSYQRLPGRRIIPARRVISSSPQRNPIPQEELKSSDPEDLIRLLREHAAKTAAELQPIDLQNQP